MMRTVTESTLFDENKFDKTASIQVAAFKKIYDIIFKFHNNPKKHDFMADKKQLDYKMLYVEIVNYCAKHKEGHTDTAWKLAQKYCSNYTSSNSELIEEIFSFTKKKNWKPPSLFSNADELLRKQIKDELDIDFFITRQKSP